MTSDNHTNILEGRFDLEPLQRLRQSIDNIDAAIVYMLAERFKVTDSIGQFKARHRLPSVDNKRESEQSERLRDLAQKASLNPDFAERFFRVIVEEVIKNHKVTMNAALSITKE